MPDLETPYSRACFPNTHHPATDESISAIVTERQQQLDSVLREISGLETVMDDIKNLHQQLIKQKDRTIQSMTFHKGIGSTLWRLPSEILSQIFYDCLPEDEYLLSPALEQAPMLLTRICRAWREVAVGMPSLWCRLCVRINISRVGQKADEEVDDSDWEEPDEEAHNRDWQRAALCYDSWLKRSRGRPLSLVLECYHSTKLLRGLLQPYINQISSLAIHFRRFPRGARRTQLLLKDLPALQELLLVGIQHSDIRTIAQSISQLPSTMRVLNIMDLVSGIPLYSFNPVWANLTHVAITLYHPDAFFDLLHLCPNLCSLTVRARFHSQQTLGPFTHANIQSLHIFSNKSNIGRRLSRLFNALSLPKLCKFEVLLAYEHRPWPHEELKDLLVRSKCPLECLTFSGQVTVTDVPRAEYVALIPSLDVVVNPTQSYY
ncbi:hypothetical protein EDB19DRAFT_894665 [Suillus lakei]|nr:hypothetical protein EDB19DRAFT_894665 [Suillus lakei]